MELLEHVIDFQKSTAIMPQILVDFIAEWMKPRPLTEGPIPKSPWLVYCDGA
jgi:hypothetical protein